MSEYRFSYRMPSMIASLDEAVVSVDAGRPPALVRTWFRSAIAPVLSPVASLASARSRMSSSLRMIGMGDVCAGQMLKPIVDYALVPAGPLRDGKPVRILDVYRSSGAPLALSCASVVNDACAYKSLFVACVSPFGESGVTA